MAIQRAQTTPSPSIAMESTVNHAGIILSSYDSVRRRFVERRCLKWRDRMNHFRAQQFSFLPESAFSESARTNASAEICQTTAGLTKPGRGRRILFCSDGAIPSQSVPIAGIPFAGLARCSKRRHEQLTLLIQVGFRRDPIPLPIASKACPPNQPIRPQSHRCNQSRHLRSRSSILKARDWSPSSILNRDGKRLATNHLEN